MLFGPFDARGAVFLVLFLINLYFGMRSAHRSLIGELPGFRTSQRPWWRVALGLGIAIVIASLARQNEFPEQFAVAQVHFKPGTKIAADLRTGYLLYLGATPDTLVLGQPGAIKKGPDCTTTILPQPTRTLLVSRSSVESIELADGQQPCRPPSSLLRRLGIPIECIAPVCEVGNKRRSFLSPFASGEP
jgi:hypothetical protein